jgi:hypothetical protein
MPFDGGIRRFAGVSSADQTARQSALVLAMMESFFDGGARWTRRAYETADGRRCLLGAIRLVRGEIGSSEDRAADYLARAINLWQLRRRLPALGETDHNSIIGFNDAHRRSFAEIAEVVAEARRLALCDASVAPNMPETTIMEMAAG